ncbi:MAG: hypothetical protein JWN76_1804 [Chitinophagaceae bacterium]|nr:hypothetical protein [Chitinophagaceae bacterium]
MKTLTTITTLLVLFLVNNISAQEAAPDFSGWRISVNAGAAKNKAAFNLTGITVLPVSNLTIPGMGVVVVPGSVHSVNDTTVTKTGVSTSFQAEYNVVIHHLLFGAEISAGKSFFKASEQFNTTLAPTLLQDASELSIQRDIKTKWERSVSAKLGYVNNKSLFYARAGLSAMALQLTTNDNYAPASANISVDRHAMRVVGAQGTISYTYPAASRSGEQTTRVSGFTWGLGYEYMVSDYISIGAEYRHAGYGQATFSDDWANADQPMNASGVKEGIGGRIGATDTHVDLKQDQFSVKCVFHLQSFLKRNRN